MIGTAAVYTAASLIPSGNTLVIPGAFAQLLGTYMLNESTSNIDMSAYAKRAIANTFASEQLWEGLLLNLLKPMRLDWQLKLVLSTKPVPLRQALKLTLTFPVPRSILNSKLPLMGQELLLGRRASNLRIHFQ